MIRFAILDDHPLVVEGIRSLFQREEPFCFAWGAAAADECLQQLKTTEVDALLLDIHLGQANGVDLCRQWKPMFPKLSILMLTSYCEVSFVKTALQNGASGYLLKNAGHAEICHALRTACAGERYLSEPVKQRMLDGLLGTRPPTPPGMAHISALTRREKEVLRLIMDEHTTAEMADKLFVSQKTIETHRMNLLQKLGARNTAGLVKAAFERNLL